MIQEVGRADLAGHPRLFGVTNDFLDYFGLNSVKDLPELQPVEEVNDEEKNLFDSRYKEDIEKTDIE